jgi:tetratricopeptide (TPR) repeat protein
MSIALIACGRVGPRSEASFLERGRTLLSQKDYSRALLEFRNAARVAPRDAEPQYQLGLTYLAAGDHRAAIDSFRRCLEMNPQHAGARLKTAELMTSSAKPEVLNQAAAELRELLALSPQTVEAVDALAVAEWRLGNREEAVRTLERLLQELPASLSSSVMLARMKLSAKDWRGAEEVLRKASASEPQSPEAALALGEMYLVTNRTTEAEPEILRALGLNPRNGQALLALAAIQSASNRLDAAEQTYRRLSALEDKQYHPLYALFLIQRGKSEQGITELRKLAKLDASDRMARTRLIAALLEAGKGSEAAQLLSEVLKENPKDVDALLQRAALSLRNGKPTEAQRDLQLVLQYRPESADAHRYMARSYKELGQWQNERRELIEALNRRKELLSARLALSRNYLNAGEANTALQVLDEAPVGQRTQLPLVIERNWALLGMNDLASARAGVTAALQAARLPAFLIQQAVLQMATHDFAGARGSAEEVLKLNPRDERAARIVAESYFAEKQPAKALERLTRLAEANPKAARIQHMLGVWQLQTGNPEAARKQFEAARRADSGFVEADLALADLDRRQNRNQDSRNRLLAVIVREPRNAGALLLLAEIEKTSGDHLAAIDHYRAVLAFEPTNLVALNNISIELTAGNPDEALAFAQRAFEIAPDNAAVQDTLGWIYYRKGIYQTAARHLKEAVSKEPNPRRKYHLGLSYIKTGELRQGRELLQSAIQQDPSLNTGSQ